MLLNDVNKRSYEPVDAVSFSKRKTLMRRGGCGISCHINCFPAGDGAVAILAADHARADLWLPPRCVAAGPPEWTDTDPLWALKTQPELVYP
jgi:hypothetical protein